MEIWILEKERDSVKNILIAEENEDETTTKKAVL